MEKRLKEQVRDGGEVTGCLNGGWEGRSTIVLGDGGPSMSKVQSVDFIARGKA